MLEYGCNVGYLFGQPLEMINTFMFSLIVTSVLCFISVDSH